MGILAHIFPRQVYAPVKQTFSIGNIVHWSSTYQSPTYEAMAQIKLRFCPLPHLDYQFAAPDLWLQ